MTIEHLQVFANDLDWYLANVTNCGPYFLNDEMTVASGEKSAGPHYILPTRGAAPYSGSMSVGKFIQTETYPRLLPAARHEAMEGHAITGDIRLKKYYPQESFEPGTLAGHPH